MELAPPWIGSLLPWMNPFSVDWASPSVDGTRSSVDWIPSSVDESFFVDGILLPWMDLSSWIGPLFRG